MYDDVLVATDGSEPAETAASHALAVAERFGATVHVLSVVDARPGVAGVGGEVAQSRARADAEAAVDRLRATAEAAGVAVTTEVDRGRPLVVIADRAADCDLLVLGSHGRTGLARFVLGSVTETLTIDPPGPVLVVPPGDHTVDYRDVLVGTDGGATAARAVDNAVAIAERYEALLHAVSVVDTRLDRTTPFRPALERAASEAVREAATAAAKRGVTVETRVLTGVPAEEILTVAESRGADLLAIGSRGGGSLDRLAVASVARRVVRAGLAPTLVVPGAESDESDVA
jgi:nucleotide-binding universal stress UspA family protein